jgi:hypothetical protein
MNIYESNSGQDIVYIDHSTSAMGASLYQSSAVPTSLASIMRNALIESLVLLPISIAPRVAGLHMGAIWASEDFDEPLPDEFWTNEE